MTPTVAALLARVQAAGGELEAKGDRLQWRAPEPLPADLLGALKARRGEVLTYLRGAEEPTSAHYTMDEILAEVESGCHACGGQDWWTDARWGGRICRICHPPPNPVCEA
jgi:hypothetical protein